MGKRGAAISIQDRLVNAGARAIIGLSLMLPYRWRVPIAGWATATFVAPIAGWPKRIRENLAHALPEFSDKDVNRIVRTVSHNVGRALIEIYSGQEFVDRTTSAQLEGPGVQALNTAREAGRPVVLVTAHMGNYDAIRSKPTQDGHPLAVLYRPMKNALFNEHYVRAISAISQPVFSTETRGVAGLVRHLRKGGVIGIVCDVGSRRAPRLTFFGKPAHTPLTAAEWALKYDAALIPAFGLRQPDGLSFRLHLGEEIPHSSPKEMMQRYNDIVEDLVREMPDQWFWVHRRWKQGTQRN